MLICGTPRCGGPPARAFWMSGLPEYHIVLPVSSMDSTVPGSRYLARFKLIPFVGIANALAIGNILPQFRHQRVVSGRVHTVIGALTCQRLQHCIPHIGQGLKLAVTIGFRIRQRVRICQRRQIDFSALGDQPGLKIDEAVIRAPTAHQRGGVPEAILIGELLVSVKNVMEILSLLGAAGGELFCQPLERCVHVLAALFFHLRD